MNRTARTHAPPARASIEAGWLAHLAGDGGLIVTATHRQAARVLAVHAAALRAEGHTAWVRPRVASWEQWLGALCAAATARGVLPPVIDGTQSRMLWGEVLVDWESANVGRLGAGALVSRAATVQGAWRAWRLWLEADLSPASLPRVTGDEESSCLAAWGGSYLRRLDALGLLDLPLAQQRLPEVLAREHLAGARSLKLLGFLELAPARRRLLAAGARLGLTLEGCPAEDEGCPAEGAGEDKAPMTHAAGRFQARHAADQESERRAAAAWARERLAADPATRIAIVVPDLDAEAPALTRVLDETLQPHRLTQGVVPDPGPVHDLAWTPSLAGWPVVADALLILGFDHGPAPAAVWTRLLLSPCLDGAEEEWAARVETDLHLRRNQLEPWPAATVIAAAGASAPRWARLFARLAQDGRAHGAATACASVWAQRFQERLAAAGWPGTLGLDDPALHQAVLGLVGRLEALASLDALLPPLDAAGALARLRTLVEEQHFRPRSAPCRLDVIPPDELPGLAWDAVWVMGLRAATFPEPIRPPPFLPATESRARTLPGTAAAQLSTARRWLAALCEAAPEGTISAPLRIGDEAHELAPLVRSWLGDPLPLTEVGASLPTLALEGWSDPYAPALSPGRHAASRRLLSDQSECPFRAFARHRVRAEAPALPARAVEARHRGEWLHAALATLWRAIGDSRTLANADETRREEWIDAAIRAAIATMTRLDDRLAGSRYARLEAERLRGLLGQWLALEQGRTEDFTVIAIETDIACAVGRLDLRLRPDRIDRLADGRQVVLDYKSGRLSPGAWLPPRPRDPQPALYALAVGEPAPSAVLIAQPDTPTPCFSGFVADADLRESFNLRRTRSAPADFPDLLTQWRESLEELAQEFGDGLARVAPRNGACRFCDIAPLCRIEPASHEAIIEALTDEESGEEEDAAESEDGE